MEAGDLRGLGKNAEVVAKVHTQEDFDHFFLLCFHHQPAVALKAIDVIEKVTRRKPEFLIPHFSQIVSLVRSELTHTFKAHLALILGRLALSPIQLKRIWALLSYWALNPAESKEVKVNALQSLYERMTISKEQTLLISFRNIVKKLERERIPTISGRIRQLRRKAKSELEFFTTPDTYQEGTVTH